MLSKLEVVVHREEMHSSAAPLRVVREGASPPQIPRLLDNSESAEIGNGRDFRKPERVWRKLREMEVRLVAILLHQSSL